MSAAGRSPSGSWAEHERARAIWRASDEAGDLTGQRLERHGLSWDDVAFAAAVRQRRHDENVARYEAMTPAERTYRADRDDWVQHQAHDDFAEPGWLDRVRHRHELRPEQRLTRTHFAAYDIERRYRLEDEYDQIMGRTPQRRGESYGVADAEADEGAENAWYAIAGSDEGAREVGNPTTSERLQATLGTALEQQWTASEIPDEALERAGLSRDDVVRLEAERRADAIAQRLPTLSPHEVMDLASHAQNVRHISGYGDIDDDAARATLRALQVEAEQRAAGADPESVAGLLVEYVDRASLDLDPAVGAELTSYRAAIERGLEAERAEEYGEPGSGPPLDDETQQDTGSAQGEPPDRVGDPWPDAPENRAATETDRAEVDEEHERDGVATDEVSEGDAVEEVEP